MITAPEIDILHFEFLLEGCCIAFCYHHIFGLSYDGVSVGGDEIDSVAYHLFAQHFFGHEVGDVGSDIDFCFLSHLIIGTDAADAGGMDKGLPRIEFQRISDDEPDVSIDAGSGIPARVTTFVDDLYSDEVVCFAIEMTFCIAKQIVGDVEAEGGVAVHVAAHFLAIHPKASLVVCSFEIEFHTLVAVDAVALVLKFQFLDVPTFASQCPSCRCLARRCLCKRPDDLHCVGYVVDSAVTWQSSKVMGQRDALPAQRVVMTGTVVYSLGVGAFDEVPVAVEKHAARCCLVAQHLGHDGRNGSQCYDDEEDEWFLLHCVSKGHSSKIRAKIRVFYYDGTKQPVFLRRPFILVSYHAQLDDF